MTTPTSSAVYYSILIWYKDSTELRNFEAQAAPYFQQHGITLHRIIGNLNAIAADGDNHPATPDEIQLVSGKDDKAFGKLFEDAEFLKLLPIREKGVRKMNILVGGAELAEDMKPTDAVQGVGLFYFEKDGKEGLRAFERRAGSFFERYGLHLSHILIPEVTMAAIGEDDIPLPDEVQFLSVESQEKLGGLFGDQGFLDLVPQRNAATRRLTFFLGQRIY